VIGVVSSGLSLGLAAGALMAALYFMAAIFVVKVALTAMLCVLLVSGALVIALWPLPQGDGLARLWGAGLVAAVTIPVSWALVFSVVGLVASDSLVGDRLGPGLDAAVKPFVAVACLYLVYKTPGFLVAQARLLGMRVSGHAGGAQAPGQARLRQVAQGQMMLQRDRFRGLGAGARRSARVSVAATARHAAGRAAQPLRVGAATAAVNAASIAGGKGPAAGAVTALALGTGRLVGAAGRSATAAARQSRLGSDRWRRSAVSGQSQPGNTSRPSEPRSPRHLHGGGEASGHLGSSTPPARRGTPPARPLRGGGERLQRERRPGGLASVADDLRVLRADRPSRASDLERRPPRLD
jgi:hypothetical protein